MKQVVIVGGGYGGLACLRGLSRRLDHRTHELVLVDATPYHTIKSRFHERAVRVERDAGMRYRLGPLAAASGARFVQEEVVEVDYAGRRVVGREQRFPYDALVLAPGGRTVYFGVEGAAEHTVSLQTYEAADRASRRVQALELGRADRPRRRVVVSGAGIEGLEVAAMLRELAPASSCEITVVERSSDVMARSQCREPQRRYLREYLRRREIGLRLDTAVVRVGPDRVVLDPAEELEADLVYWCSGVRREVVGAAPPEEPFLVDRHLRRPDHPEVFALGDFATVDTRDEVANLGSAQRAVYHGEVVAENVARTLAGRPLRPARYRPIGELVGLGDLDGVGIVHGLPVHGVVAATAKKLQEVRYLTELYGDVPGTVGRYLLSRVVPGGPG